MVVAVAAGGALWFVLHRPAKALAELVERSAYIQFQREPIWWRRHPDGKHLAYSDRAGIHVRLLSTGEERLIPTPAVVAAGAVPSVDSWFPNGTELLAHSEGVGRHETMWSVSIMGQSSRELRGDASGWEVSPDGKYIAFSPSEPGSDRREIWVMDRQGENPQRVLGVAAGEGMWSVHWSLKTRSVFCFCQAYTQARQLLMD
jgi:Tol biopolymer transport system component